MCCVKLFNGAIESFAVVKQLHTISFIVFQVYSLLRGQKVDFFLTITVILGLTLGQLGICWVISRRKGREELV